MHQGRRREDKPLAVQRKRLQYRWLTDEQRRDLIFRTMYLNENVRAVCRDLDINFLTGRNLVQKYKKTGEYDVQSKAEARVPEPANIKGTATKDSNRKASECPLGIILLPDNKMKVVSYRAYRPDEESALVYLHSLLKSHNIV
ncbi:MAG: hypothetical protein P4L69_19295 [Desulfosporosinus sp.]|nr:hypothetical protein [Desulfosporosinus sp.]